MLCIFSQLWPGYVCQTINLQFDLECIWANSICFSSLSLAAFRVFKFKLLTYVYSANFELSNEFYTLGQFKVGAVNHRQQSQFKAIFTRIQGFTSLCDFHRGYPKFETSETALLPTTLDGVHWVKSFPGRTSYSWKNTNDQIFFNKFEFRLEKILPKFDLLTSCCTCSNLETDEVSAGDLVR